MDSWVPRATRLARDTVPRCHVPHDPALLSRVRLHTPLDERGRLELAPPHRYREALEAKDACCAQLGGPGVVVGEQLRARARLRLRLRLS